MLSISDFSFENYKMKKMTVTQNKQSILISILAFNNASSPTSNPCLYCIFCMSHNCTLISSCHCDLSKSLLTALVPYNLLSLPQLNCISTNLSYPLETSKQNMTSKRIKLKVQNEWDTDSTSPVFPSSLT